MDRNAAPVTERSRLEPLLVRVAEASPDAFAELYELMSPRVYGLAQQLARDPEISQEIAQEVFLQIWQKAHTYDPSHGHPVAWLMLITQRRALDRIRAEQAFSLRDAAHYVASYLRDFDQTADTALGRIEEEAVPESLSALTRLQHEAITLAFYDGLTYEQVGVRLGISTATVKTRIRDGLIRLRNHKHFT